MTLQAWCIYVMFVIIATFTPGTAVVFIMTNSALHGWKKAIFAALGNIAGLFCLGIMAVTGLGAILKTSEAVFTLVKYAGALYLVYLGLKMAFQKSGEMGTESNRAMPAVSGPRLFWQAFGVAMSNPKAIVFLTALFPQFINPANALPPQFAALIATLMSFSFFFLMSYALLAHSARAWLTTPGRVQAIHRTGGALFVGLGVLLATASHK